MVLRILVRHIARVLLTVLAAGLLGATMVRLAPAFGVSESELDPRFSGQVQLQRAEPPDPLRFYGKYLRGLVTGDLGISPSLQRPIVELLKERLPVSIRSLVIGAAGGVGVAFGLAILAIAFRSPVTRVVPLIGSTVLLSIPSAALGLLFLVAGWPPALALAAVIFPRVYRYAYATLVKSSDAPHVMAAKARGLSSWRILRSHVVPVAGPQLLAIVGMAIGIGFPALVPIEAVCDSPGILQLALKAAVARDLPLLVALTMVASLVILLGNAAADVAAEAVRSKA